MPATVPSKKTFAVTDNRPDSISGPPFLYDPSAFGLSFLWKWQGTILPLVASSPLFWFLLIGHGVVVLMYQHLDGDEPVLEWQAAIVPSSLLTFLLVTFGNQCCERRRRPPV